MLTNQEPTNSTFNKHCHTDLHLPVCVSTALVAMAADLDQHQLSLTRRVGQSVSFSCGTQLCGTNNIDWFQKKDTEPFRMILYISKDGKVGKGFNHPQEGDFTAVRAQSSSELKIETVKVSHSASYYCSCWKSGSHNKDIVKPVVSVYPAASRAHLGGKTSLLCLASGMFPPLVQFSWKRQEEDGNLVDVSSLGLHISLFTFCSSLKDFNIHSLILLECPTAQQIPITQLSLHRSD
uniref:Ig-like domain-containing protein n=1 Tax=Lates calcarifer TaxID=8187 RepID=A0A4W6CM93_LATCA